ncbi:serine hydrolase [Chitinimonas sp.]|uniref:serine hydrolase domain-containing protein n=1 Tax=Chitinimonas sp. TaxID=1934313 RepID=UPI002F959CE9
MRNTDLRRRLGLGLAAAMLPTLLLAAPCDVPASKADGWVVAPAQDVALDADKLCGVLRGFADGQVNFHGLVVARRGQLVAEAYRQGRDKAVSDYFSHTVQFDAERQHDMRSISKSVTSLLWGIAQAQGKTPPLNTPVLDLLPDLAELRSNGRDGITLAHLLSMSSGLEWKEWGSYGALSNDEFGLFWHSSQARYLFNRPLAAPPGSKFNYNGGGTAVLAQILSERVGMSLPDYARRYLFEPLGITEFTWQNDLRGRPLAFAGLRLRPRDLAKIGQLVLNEGQWNGKQVVPTEWLAESTLGRLSSGDGMQYGYQWWSGTVEVHGKTRSWVGGIGNGGQRLYVVPELELVVAITAGDYDQPEIGYQAYQLFKRIANASQG